MAQTGKMYQELRSERLRFLKLDYTVKEPDDVESLVSAFDLHF
jgi:hypothetical protein